MLHLRRLGPLLFLGILINIILQIFRGRLTAAHFDVDVLTWANLILVYISILSYAIQARGLNNKNPNVFVRSVMGGMMIKMAICILAIFFYVSLSGSLFNKRAIFVSMLLYLVYLAVEVWIVFRMNKRNNA